MPVGEYKRKYIINSLNNKYPIDDYFDCINDENRLKIPKINYNQKLFIPPIQQHTNNNSDESNYTIARNTNSNLKLINSGVGLSTNIPSIPGYMNKLGIINNVPETFTEIGKITNNIGNVTTAIGGLTSGIKLGLDIANAVNDKKVSFDNAMNIADDATGVVSSALSFIPGVGVPLSIAASIGEKLVTGGIKAGKAVKEDKEKEHVKHLKPGIWLDTVVDATTPHWMNTDFKTLKQEYKKNKPIREAQKKQEKVDYKNMSYKDKAKKFFFG
jgi:hypothetical protein